MKPQPCHFGHGEENYLAGSCPLGHQTVKDLRGQDHNLVAGKERGCTCLGKVTGYLIVVLYEFCKGSAVAMDPGTFTAP